ncbi:PPE domain-containing protein [Gordonia soli]|uniref:PPE domain-containing protein n=1 Tax=Gordonia soli NBRC 108243 TaxID=1223545 RepID=M0QD06_9ACTN|nr:PPE domain-containing protein [Gordonia soli]GAC66206.1 hypothetical protein GS4_01_00070 [Gordonia soli NBRC 108243]
MTGFTGVVWDARTTERLAADLAAGAGPAPLAEAGAAWAGLGRELAAAGVEYSAILARLATSWESVHASAAFEKLTRLAPWFGEIAAEAGRNAARSESQAAAITVARLSMPNIAEVDLAEKMREIATAASAVAPALGGAAAHVERAIHEQQARASRVMQTYESATEPVGTPWGTGLAAPNLVSGHALSVEQAAREAAARAAVAPTPSPTPAVSPAIGPMWAGSYTQAAEKTRYAPTMVAGAAPAAVVPGPTPVAAPAATGAVPPPMPMHGVVAANERTVQVKMAGAADESAPAPTESLAGESLSDDEPRTWADIAVAATPVADHAVTPVADQPPTSPYVTETLSLGSSGGGR